MKSIGIKPDWCEGYVTLARAQREMGEVLLSLESYKKAIDLLDHAESLSEEEKEEIRRERMELVVLLDVCIAAVCCLELQNGAWRVAGKSSRCGEPERS